MTKKRKNKKGASRKRLLSFLTGGIFALHALAFLILAQCGGVASGDGGEVSYISVNVEEKTELDFNFEAPPERMFYQYASAPISGEVENAQPISSPRWDGYQTLVALKVADSSSMEHYRLTLESTDEAKPRGRRPLDEQPVFRTVVLRGVEVQPITSVPEPSSASLVALAFFLFARRQRRA